MAARRPCPPPPGPLEEYEGRFDDLFFRLAQRRGFRDCLTRLLASRERKKTMTCLAGAEPVTSAEMLGAQWLQFFLSESPWEAEQINDRRLELLSEESATAPHDSGVIGIDDSGDPKDGTATAHVGRQWLGRNGKTDHGIVTVTTVWTDGRVYHPLHTTPTPLPITSPRGRGAPLRPSVRNRSWPRRLSGRHGSEHGRGALCAVGLGHGIHRDVGSRHPDLRGPRQLPALLAAAYGQDTAGTGALRKELRC
ncbi:MULTISPECIES: transposase [Streptomyces]|nr:MULTISPECIES: transposase [Streptomyces]